MNSVLIPLSLYIHIPWCVRKCPYCDFNSHQQKGEIPEQEYIAHLLADLDTDIKQFDLSQRILQSIFIGGGTPSLLSVEAMHTLIEGVNKRLEFAQDIEITMEANPGTVEAGKFSGFQDAGINRISIGIQSFQEKHLDLLGRIHNGTQSINAIHYANELHLRSFNTDLMHGLPEQSLENALEDLNQAISLSPPHLSWYQLTIEPNTLFYSKPPTLPDDDILWDIQIAGQQLLETKGYQQYEISGYSKPGHQCEHNLNYWRFGDYIGIGCGAHGKLSDVSTKKIMRTVKVKHPKGYMDLTKPYLSEHQAIDNSDLPFEFFMNRFRLLEACPLDDYQLYTFSQLPKSTEISLKKAQDKGLLIISDKNWLVTDLGRRYLNTLLEEFV